MTKRKGRRPSALNSATARTIRNARLEKGLNQTDLARLCDVTQSSVSLWEKGAVPQTDKVNVLCRVLGLSREQLLGAAELDKSGSTVTVTREVRECGEVKSIAPFTVDGFLNVDVEAAVVAAKNMTNIPFESILVLRDEPPGTVRDNTLSIFNMQGHGHWLGYSARVTTTGFAGRYFRPAKGGDPIINPHINDQTTITTIRLPEKGASRKTTESS